MVTAVCLGCTVLSGLWSLSVVFGLYVCARAHCDIVCGLYSVSVLWSLQHIVCGLYCMCVGMHGHYVCCVWVVLL